MTSSAQPGGDGLTEIILMAANTAIPAVLNHSRTAKELIARLPLTVTLDRYEHDYCGVISPALPYDGEDLKNGWKNGEIAFAADGSYFAILYKDEEISAQFGNLVTLGRLKDTPSVMETLPSRISLKIALR